jgi:hypothetical protein
VQKFVAVTNNGVGKQSIQIIDVQKEQHVSGVTVGKAWYGLAWSADEKRLVASGVTTIRSLPSNILRGAICPPQSQ